MFRYAGDENYQLPVSCDVNTSTIYNDRLLIGFTYRSDKSFETIVHLQVTRRLNMGYAYDVLGSDLGQFSKSTHEFVIGFEMKRKDDMKFVTPRFSKTF